jgi:antitoxin component YwqK of YwqJK toxin-antitoxin module
MTVELIHRKLLVLISTVILLYGCSTNNGSKPNLNSLAKEDSIGKGRPMIGGTTDRFLEGKVKNGKREGVWVCYFNCQTCKADERPICCKESYVDGLLDGECLFYFDDGKLNQKRNYVKGLLEGDEIYYHPNGQICDLRHYLHGILDGVSYSCLSNGKRHYEATFLNGTEVRASDGKYENGQLKVKETIVNGFKEGESVYYRENGDVFLKEHYLHGIFNGDRLMYQDNSLISKEHFVDGKLEGEKLTYHLNGQIAMTETYVNNVKEGKRQLYSIDGKLLLSENYLNGKLEGERIEYNESGHGIWDIENYKGGVRLHKEKELPAKVYASDGQKCSRCIGHYHGGECDLCGASSPDRVMESYANAPKCEYCKGSGFIKGDGIHDPNKVCPSCKGTGKQIY